MIFLRLNLFFGLTLIYIYCVTPFFGSASYYSILILKGKKVIASFFNRTIAPTSLFFLFGGLLRFNLLGNIPFTIVPTMFYSVTVTVRLVFWMRLIITGALTNYYKLVGHLLPYGCPIGLFVLLPLIELLSQVLRPITLAIRISTNLAAGHILVFIFRYFGLLLPGTGKVLLRTVVLTLQGLELVISILQAYIFVALLVMYLVESTDTVRIS